MLLDRPPSWRQKGRPQPIDKAEGFSERMGDSKNSASKLDKVKVLLNLL